MKISLPTLLLVLTLSLAIESARATDFNLRARKPGPGHSQPTQWWAFNKTYWELVTPEGFELTGGAELRLQKKEGTPLLATCQQATANEFDLLDAKNTDKQAAYVAGLLPSGAKEVTKVSQALDSLAVNGLTNFEVVYEYSFHGASFRFTYLVSRAVGDDPKATKGEGFATKVVADPEKSDEIYHAFMQLLGTARVSTVEPHVDEANQYQSRGMLGR